MNFSVEIEFEPFEDIERILSGAAEEGAGKVVERIGELMREPKSGNRYKHGDGTIRAASAEGEAPGIDSMDLVGSFEAITLSSVEAEITTDVGYGMILQEKRNRPFTDPAVELALPDIIELIEGRFDEQWR